MNWAEVVANEYAVPEGMEPVSLLPELFEMLKDADPRVRDEQAYGTLAQWTQAGHFDAQLRELGDQCAQNLSSPNVLLRSFSVLILGEAVFRNRTQALLPAHVPAIWRQCWDRWYPDEPDVRSYEEGVGWIHTVAHGADFALEWALFEDSNDGLRHLMDTITGRLRTLPIHLNQGESDRIALALLAVLSRPLFEPEDIDAWLADYRTLWTDLEPGPMPPGAVLAVQTLKSLYVLLRLGANVGGEPLRAVHNEQTVQAVETTLKTVYPIYGFHDTSAAE